MSDIADVIKLVNKETEREDLSEEIKQYLFCDLRHKLWKMDTIMPDGTLRTKEYSMPDGRTGVFEYDHNGVGKITLENMDMLMGMITDRLSGEWIYKDDSIFAGKYYCDNCDSQAEVDLYGEWILSDYCPHCGARMFAKDINVPNKEGADDERHIQIQET